MTNTTAYDREDYVSIFQYFEIMVPVQLSKPVDMPKFIQEQNQRLVVQSHN